MPFVTRDQLIALGRWATVTIQTEEVGPLRLAAPAASGVFRIRELQQAKASETDLVAQVLLSSCIDEAGKPAFQTLESARALLDTLAPDTVSDVLQAFGRLPTRPTPGNSGASQGDGSPSASH